MIILSNQTARAKRCALYYRSLGLQPLPSRADAKRPALHSFTEWWEEPLPDSVYTNWSSPNVQLMCGSRWGLVVVDCDGPEAIAEWARMVSVNGGHEPTWVVETGSGGRHVYFSQLTTSPGVQVISGRLWGVWETLRGKGSEKTTGKWASHKEIRILGQGSLVIAPPSVHVRTGNPYRFLNSFSPREIKHPSQIPGWLKSIPHIKFPSSEFIPPSPCMHNSMRYNTHVLRERSGSRDQIMDAIQDKAAMAAAWGLRLARRTANQNGWIACRAVGRDDHVPSASFNPTSGVYWDGRESGSLSFFDLAVLLGAYPTWKDARDDLARRYLR